MSLYGLTHPEVPAVSMPKLKKKNPPANPVGQVARRTKSTLNEVAKSQLDNGDYKPISQMSPLQRSQHSLSLRASKNSGDNHFRYFRHSRDVPLTARTNLRNIHGAYHNYGVEPGLSTALGEKTRPSKVHPNVHYGESISAEHEKKLDAQIEPHLARRSKGVVFHRGKTHVLATAGAAPSHRMLGGKARIILSHHQFDHEGNYTGNSRPEDVINHELGHTVGVRANKNPYRLNHMGTQRASGEEGRADAIGIRRKLYTELGNWTSDHYHHTFERTQAHQPAARHSGPPERPSSYQPHVPWKPPHGWDYPSHSPRPIMSEGARGALVAGAVTAGVTGALALHHHRESKVAKTADEIFKVARITYTEGKHHRDPQGRFASIGARLKEIAHQVSETRITSEQARHAGVFGQIGGAAGSLTGATIGATVGAFAHRPAQGAGIGALAGGALGGGGGAALGLYAGRPRKKRQPYTAPLSKAMDPEKKDKLQRRLATGALGVGAVGDIAGAKSAFNETRRAKYVAPETEGLGPKIGAAAKFASEKAAFPLVAAGLGATALATHELNKPAVPKQPKPRKAIG